MKTDERRKTMQGSSRVEQIVRRKGGVLMVSRDTSITEAARIMRDNNVGAVIISESEGTIAGILTERDVISKVVSYSANPDTTMVSAVMTSSVITCTMETTICEAQETMATHRVRHVPVVADGIPIGVISVRDIVQQQLSQAQTVIREQSVALQDLEEAHPGISRLHVDDTGRIVI